jgi:hypothetical protein
VSQWGGIANGGAFGVTIANGFHHCDKKASAMVWPTIRNSQGALQWWLLHVL